MNINVNRLLRLGLSIYRKSRRLQKHSAASARRQTSAAANRSETHAQRGNGQLSAPYPGDYTGPITSSYSPHPDGKADPGEIVWTWVPYREDHAQGKDRPILLIGHDGKYLLGLMLTSKDHNNAHTQDRDYVDIGTGDWDRKGRPSEIRIDRIIRVLDADIRRDGAILDRERFDTVIAALKAR